VQNQARDFPLRGDMQRRGRAQAGPKNNDGTITRELFERIESRERCWSQPNEARRSCAAPKARVVHPPHFYRAVVPHLGLLGDPAVRAIGVAIKSQYIDLRLAALSR
jgi:hypothetical protein